MSQLWPTSKAIALVFWPKMSEQLPKLKLIEFDCRLNSDEHEPILAKKQGYSLGILAKNERTITEIEID